MPVIKTFSEVQAVLEPYIQELPTVHQAYSLSRMLELLLALGNPQDKLRIVHVAGTSGKTSTCYYLAAMLGQAGQKVGLTVSPHIMEVNERLQINLEPLAEPAYCAALTEFIAIVETLAVRPTYFELLIAMAYWYFAKEGVDYAVVEVGLGGLLDSTNVCSRPDKVCIITDIGLDHQAVLGDTLAAISSQKAGIIQAGNAVFCYRQAPVVLAAIEARAISKNARLTLYDFLPNPQDNLKLPSFQQRNWQLAAKVYDYIRIRDGLAELSAGAWTGTKQIYIPGRMEVVQYEGKTLILDGAHNPQKMQAFLTSVSQMYASESIAALAAFKATKDATGCLQSLTAIANRVILTQLAAGNEIPATLPTGNVENVTDIPAALKQLIAGDETLLLVTGSFMLVQSIKQLIATE
ncbi:MAG: Mur ligase family protein [Patescibacteria group bacterium]|nr:Mur ligase family protein [Patescibacteria group bacterium]